MSPNSAVPSSFDDFLDRYLRGDTVDADGFLAAHPELDDAERRQVRSLAGSSTEAGPETGPDAPPLARLGEYRLVRRLGAGATGVVYLAEQEPLAREVALKILPDLRGEHRGPDRFLREVRAVARLRHEGIVAVHAAGVESGLRYMAMEYVRGRGLDDVIADAAERGVRPLVSEILGWGRDLASALQAAHDAGIVHRDVKPSNVRITTEGRAVLLDFGLALEAGAATLTASGAFCGSPRYASPEQVGVEGTVVGPATDVYSLGATLYEALVGTAPFRGETREQLFRQILAAEPIPLRRLDPSIPRDVETVVLAALAKDPRRRHPSAGALAGDLVAIGERRPISVRPMSTVARLVRGARREPVVAVLLGAVLITLPVLAALVTSHVKDRPAVAAAREARLAAESDRVLAAASVELAEGNARVARDRFGAAYAIRPNVEAVAGMMLASLELGEVDDAAAIFARHGSLLHGSAAGVMLRADMLRAQGRVDEANELEGSAPWPRDALDHHILGARALLVGESETRAGRSGRDAFARALRDATRAILLAPGPRLLFLSLRAHAAAHLEDEAVAEESAAVLRTLWPDSPFAHHWAGFVLAAANDSVLRSGAVGAFREACRLQPDLAVAHHQLGHALMRGGRAVEAVVAQREAVRLRPDIGEHHASLGDALRAEGLLAEAESAHREAVRVQPSLARAHTGLGNDLYALGRIDEALAAHAEAVRLAPELAEAHVGLGIALGAKGRLDDAISELRTAVDLRPALALAHGHLGTALRLRGLAEEAVAAYREAIRLDPELAEAHTNLGIVLETTDRLDDAIAAHREAIRLAPGLAKAHTNLGHVLQRRGRPDEAIAAHREAIRLAPGLSVAHVNLGVALHAVGALDEAIDAWREALRIEPRTRRVSYLLAKTLDARGRLAEAIEAFRAATAQDPGHAEAHCDLGLALLEADRSREAVASLTTGHQLGSRRSGWAAPSARWLEEAERRMRDDDGGDALLARWLDHAEEPSTAEEMTAMARAAARAGRHAIAVRWFEEALAEAPRRETSRSARYQGACAALLAAAADPDDAAAWRRRAATWLDEDLDALEERSASGAVDASFVGRIAVRWQQEPALAPVRGAAIDGLPAEERAVFADLWERLARLWDR